jgi:phospholipid/cholesterol/gamma-HCH transport system permease protein
MELAQAGARSADSAGAMRPPGTIARLGLAANDWLAAFLDALRFVGEMTMATAALATGRARFPLRDLALVIESTGARSLPIISLIAVLVGMILAFIGALQLAQFGAEIYVANLVAVGMLREMGAMMAAIVMAGRTGAAFAAEIGAMRVNEEIDALVATGLSPQEFLVLPRVGGLLLMLPLLTVYADVLGILGGALIGIGVLDIRPALYLDQTLLHLSIRDFGAGVLKAYVFAIVVSLAGCYHGLRCGLSSAAVGVAATRAVVAGIVGVIVTDALFTLVYHALGI